MKRRCPPALSTAVTVTASSCRYLACSQQIADEEGGPHERVVPPSAYFSGLGILSTSII